MAFKLLYGLKVNMLTYWLGLKVLKGIIAFKIKTMFGIAHV